MPFFWIPAFAGMTENGIFGLYETIKVNRSKSLTLGTLAHFTLLTLNGGERGIRTLGTTFGSTRDFQSRSFSQLGHLSHIKNPGPKDQARPLKNTPFCPISALRSDFNPRNIQYIPVVKILTRLDLDQNWAFFKGLQVLVCP